MSLLLLDTTVLIDVERDPDAVDAWTNARGERRWYARLECRDVI